MATLVVEPYLSAKYDCVSWDLYSQSLERLKKILVGGIPTPLKNMNVNWDDDTPTIWKKNPVMFQSPPTRICSSHHQHKIVAKILPESRALGESRYSFAPRSSNTLRSTKPWVLKLSLWDCGWWRNRINHQDTHAWNMSQMLHVCNISQHFTHKWPKCR